MRLRRGSLFALLPLLLLGLAPAAPAAGTGPDPASPAPATLVLGERSPAGGPKVATWAETSTAVPGPAPAGPTVAGTEDVIMQEGFEDVWPNGLWSAYDSDGAVSGEYFWDDVNNYCNPSYGENAAWPANGGPSPLDPCDDGHYVNNMDSWMVYGPFDLRPYSSAHLEFWYWNQSELNWDFFKWGASHNGSTYYVDSVSGNSGGWQKVDLPLTDFLGDDSVWIAFVFQSDASNTGIGPYVDDVTLSGVAVFPGEFVPVFPANGATNVPVDTSLSWSSSHYATEYEYCIDTIDDNECDVPWVSTGPNNYSPKLSLDHSTTYYWTPRAHNDVGYRWTEIWKFSTPIGNDEPGSALAFTSLPFWRDEEVGTATASLQDPTLNCAGGSPVYNTVWFKYTAPNDWLVSLSTLGSEYDTVLGVFIGAPGALHEWACSDDFGGTAQSAVYFNAEPGTAYYIEVASKAPLTAGQLRLVVRNPILASFLVKSSGPSDGWVREQDESAGKGGMFDASSTVFRLGDDALDRQYRSILSFDTSGLPETAVVTGVILRVKREGITGRNPFTTHGILRVDMRTGFFHGVEALERYDFQAPGSRGNVGRFIKVMDADGWYRAPLRAPAYSLINLTGVTQFRLRFDLDDNDDLGADYLSLFSGDAADDPDRPELFITCFEP